MLNQATHISLAPRLLPGSDSDTTELRDLDRAFRLFYVERMLPVTRSALGIWLVLVIAVTVLDTFLMPQAFVEQTVALRVVAMLLPLVAALAATFLINKRLWLPYVTAVAAFVVGASALAVGAKAVQVGATDVYWSIVFATSCIYSVLGLTLRQSIGTAWPLFIGYLGISGASSMTIEASAYGVLFLGLLNVIGPFVSYLLERNARELFDNKQELLRLARTDGLTGLFSRRAFDQHVRQIWKQARRDEKRVAVAVADIDHFRLYNDCYGHRMGDGCIRAVAGVVAESVNRPLDMSRVTAERNS